MQSHFEEFERVLAESAEEMFAAYEKECAHAGQCDAPAPSDQDMVMASIGFGSDHARGNLSILAPRPVVEALQPSELEAEADTAVCDVLGEFANMLVGRLKNQFLPRGVQIMLGMPTTGLAREVRLKSADGASCAWHKFELEAGGVFMRLDVSFDEDFELGEESHVEQGPVGAEGDMMLF